MRVADARIARQSIARLFIGTSKLRLPRSSIVDEAAAITRRVIVSRALDTNPVVPAHATTVDVRAVFVGHALPAAVVVTSRGGGIRTMHVLQALFALSVFGVAAVGVLDVVAVFVRCASCAGARGVAEGGVRLRALEVGFAFEAGVFDA